MLIALLTEKEYVTLRLPDRAEGKFALRDSKDGSVLFSFTGAGESWQIGESENGRLKKGEPEVLENGKLIRVRIRKDWENALLFAEEAKERYARFARVAVPDQATYRIGSSSACDFRLTLPFAAPYHCALSCAKRSWSVTDQGSETGTYVNGKRIAKGSHPLHPGDVVSVMNQKFIVLPGLLAFNAQSVDVAPLKALFQPVKLPKLSHLKALGKEQETAFFHRQPRFTETAEAQEFSVEAPPEQQGQQDETPALLTYGPAVTSGAVMLMGGLNPWMSAGMLASSILFPALNRKRMKALQAETEEKRRAVYSEYLNQMEQEIRTLEQKQAAFLRSHIIDPVSEANRLLQSDRDLWSRRSLHDDFLELRLGTGDIPTKANINFPAETLQLADDPMKDLLREFQDRPRVLKNVPITMDLSRFYSVGIAGSSEHRLNFAASLIGQLVMHIGYDDLKLCLIGALHGPLKSFRWLPHTWDNAGDIHYTAGNREEMNRLVPLLDAELTLHRMEDRREKAAGSELVILITDAELAHTGVLTRLLFDRQYENVHIITLARHGSLLPSRTDAAISILENKGRMVFQDGSQRMLRDFVPDLPLTDLTARLCDKMANTLLDLRTEASVLPTNVPFLELFGVQDVAHLNLLRRWEQANPIRTLSAPIGLSEDGDLLTLDIHEKGDGPHGLVAGTTGSGKSELLMTYILSMAVNYSPEDVAFALIDYKGGGMANAFQELPHTVGVITNLDGSSLERSLTSIESENKRR